MHNCSLYDKQVLLNLVRHIAPHAHVRRNPDMDVFQIGANPRYSAAICLGSAGFAI